MMMLITKFTLTCV